MDRPWHHPRRGRLVGRCASWSLLTAAAVAGMPAALSALAGPRVDEPGAAYELVAQATVSLLPPPFSADVLAHARTFERAALEGPRDDAPAAKDDDVQRHYIMLDVAARDGNWRARHAAACQFPRDRDRAVAFFRRHGERGGGLLPWALVERLDPLARALEQGKGKDVAREAGIIVHLSGDAAWPFNTTSAGAPSITDSPMASAANSAGGTAD